MRHLWEQFRGLFLSGQRLSFPWIFLSQQGLCALRNPCLISENSFGANFWVGSNSIFLDCLWVNKGCVGWRIIRHLWKQFRGLFLSGQRLSFPWCFLSQQVLWLWRIPCVISGNSFSGDFWVGSDSVFLDCLWVNKGCVGWRINLTPVEAVSGAISDLATTQFSLTVYESTGAVCVDESKHQLCKQFRWWFMNQHRLSFPWLFVSQQWLCALFESIGAVCIEESMSQLLKQFRWWFLSR